MEASAANVAVAACIKVISCGQVVVRGGQECNCNDGCVSRPKLDV